MPPSPRCIASLLAMAGAGILPSVDAVAAGPVGPDIVARHAALFTSPPRSVPTRGMPDGPLLGNGDVGVVLGGTPEAQFFHIGKNDFWTRTPGDARVITVGRVEMRIHALKGATYRQEQDMARAEVRGTFTRGSLTLRTRSWMDAHANLIFTEMSCDGGAGTPVSVRVASGAQGPAIPRVVDNGRPVTIGRELHGGGRWYFDGAIADVIVTNALPTGRVPARPVKPERFDGKTVWREMSAPPIDGAVCVAAWINIASMSREANYIVSKGEWNQAYSLGLSNGRLRWAINGEFVQTEQPLATGKWIYVEGRFDGAQMCALVDGELKAGSRNAEAPTKEFFSRRADQLPGCGRVVAVACRAIGADDLDFSLKPGRPVTIATSVLSDLDPGANDGDANHLARVAKKMVTDLLPSDIAKRVAGHRAWWSDFWSRSFVEIPDKEIEKRWYAAMYVMGSCSRPGKVAPGLWGNWITTDRANWHGDFHLNYNFQAPFYIVYSANHADLSLPFYQAIIESVPGGRAMAKRHGWKGVHFPVCIGPWGLHPENPDGDWGQRSDAAYAALNFIWYWHYTQDEAWLRQTGYPYLIEVADFWEDYLRFENGRYVIYSDSIHEGSGPDFNPLLTLGLLRTLFTNMIPMSVALDCDAARRAKWKDICDKISAFPVMSRDGKTVFRYTEKGMAWNNGNTLGIQHIFPAGAIGLGSDPALLEISRNMIDAMRRWHDGNGFSSWYTACARTGCEPAQILAKLRAECDRCSMPNLVLNYGGGGIENVSGFLAINEMLLQSHEGILRFFPCWPAGQDARFGDLRAVGAFLVSAARENGQTTGVKIVSEKGRACAIQNPWPGRAIRIFRNGKPAESVTGTRIDLATAIAETITLEPQ